MTISRLPLLIVMALLLASGAAAAHSPHFADENTSLDTATVIEDIVKSQAIYSHMGSGEVLYLTFQIDEGDRLLLDLIIPVEDGDGGFLPGMAFMAPGIANEGALPTWVEVPAGYGYRVVNTSLPEETIYEGFTPSAFYDLGRTDGPAPVTGAYYVVVYTLYAQEGHFALVVGFAESFTVDELVLMPFSLYTVYLWEGQEPWQILAPMAATMVLGAAVMFYYRKRLTSDLNLQRSLLLSGGLLIMGTGSSTLVQTIGTVMGSHLGPEVLISVVLFSIPGLLGYLMLKRGWNAAPLNRNGRMKAALCGLLSIVVWAGYLIGPILILVATLLPEMAAGQTRH